eukprot:8558991-Ditylum_brightwellii.AAC.1
MSENLSTYEMTSRRHFEDDILPPKTAAQRHCPEHSPKHSRRASDWLEPHRNVVYCVFVLELHCPLRKKRLCNNDHCAAVLAYANQLHALLTMVLSD